MTNADPRTFDLFATEEAITYPTDSITLYRDRASMYELKKLEDRINSALGVNVEALEAKATEIREKVQASSLTVTFKGLPTPVIAEIRDSIPVTSIPQPDVAEMSPEDAQATLRLWESEMADAEEAHSEAVNMKFIESMLVSITRADGATAPHPGELTEKWFNSLPPEDRRKILQCVRDLSFSALEYEVETESADF